jgi:electron transport complex protein RnfD
MNSEIKLQDNLFTVSTSPHIRGDESISKIMWTVNLALAPAAIFAIYNFGIPALITLLVGSLSAVGLEYIVQKIRKKPVTVSDGSAFLTGLLLAMCLPPTIPPYMAIVGSFIAIVIAKHSMGGLGYNIFNPAHIGRAAIMVSWPVAMTTWTKLSTSVDVVTTATPLNILKQQGYRALIDTFGSAPQMYKAMFIGSRNGSIGETSTVLLLLGGVYLIYKGYVNWHVPVFMIGTVGILTWVFGPLGLFSGDPIFHMMAGGLIIGF